MRHDVDGPFLNLLHGRVGSPYDLLIAKRVRPEANRVTVSTNTVRYARFKKSLCFGCPAAYNARVAIGTLRICGV